MSTKQGALWITVPVVAAAGVGAVIALAVHRVADTAAVLGFIGGIIGAGASVWGAFAVVERSASQQRAEARSFLLDVARGIADDMAFLQRMQDATEQSQDYRALVARIDSIASGIPVTSDLLNSERFEVRAGSIRTVAAALRFRAALEVAKPYFAILARDRRAYRLRVGEVEDVTVSVPTAVIADLKEACRIAVREL